MKDAGSDKATAAVTGAGSMDATNTIAQDPPFHAPGSVSAGSYGAKVTPELPLFPAQADANTAGPGDRGGLVTGEGASPFADRADDWVNVDNHSSPGWAGTTAPDTGHGH